MNREQYLVGLSAALNRMPKEEKQAAMEYYREYTMELEVDGKDLINTLGEPRVLADVLLSDFASRSMMDINTPTKRKANAVLIAIAIICGLPIAIPLAIAFLAVIFAVMIAGIALVFAGLASVVVIVIAGVVCFYSAITVLFFKPMTGVSLLGISFVCIGVGLLFWLIVIKLFGLVISFIGFIFNKITIKKSKPVYVNRVKNNGYDTFSNSNSDNYKVKADSNEAINNNKNDVFDSEVILSIESNTNSNDESIN